jgi:hypothetical protein
MLLPCTLIEPNPTTYFIVLSYRLPTGWAIGWSGFESLRGLGIFRFSTESRSALGPTYPPIQYVQGALSLGVRRPRREAGHTIPSSAEVKECVGLYLHYPNTSSWRGAYLSTGTTLPLPRKLTSIPLIHITQPTTAQHTPVKVKLSLCLTKHRAMKTYWGSGGTAPCILDLCTRWSWVVSFTHRPLYPQGKSPGTHWIGGWMGPRAGLDTVAKRKIPCPRPDSHPRYSSP